MKIVIDTNDKHGGGVAAAALHFTDGPLAGLKLIGFTIYRRPNGTVYATLPSRIYTVKTERRSFALLRPLGETPEVRDRLLDAIAAAYRAQVDHVFDNEVTGYAAEGVQR